MGFKDIYFISGTNDIYVYSADAGKTIYKYSDKIWLTEEEA